MRTFKNYRAIITVRTRVKEPTFLEFGKTGSYILGYLLAF